MIIDPNLPTAVLKVRGLHAYEQSEKSHEKTAERVSTIAVPLAQGLSLGIFRDSSPVIDNEL